jgi:N-acylneuraminate cytidylyltransferase
MILCIIPARLNSKRLPRKNIKNFYGKPIIGHAIQAAINSKIFDKIIVSTDSGKVGLLSRKYGAEYLFKRPKKLSGDFVWPKEVIKHAIKWVEKNIEKPKLICCIYPTAPLLLPEDLINSFKLIKKYQDSYIFSAVENSYPIQRSVYLDNDNNIKMFNKKYFYKRSQDLRKTFHDAGQFYWASYETWMKNKTVFGKKSKFYLLPRLRVQDIDTIQDWRIVEVLYKLLKK